MARRPSVGDMLKDARPSFQPTARPVDTFIRPADPNETKSDVLNKALASLDTAFKPALRKGSRRAAEKLKAEGEQLFQKNRKDFGDAVRDGDVPFGASPFVKKGYRRAMLHTLGATYGTELNRALEQSNLHELSDPAEVEQFIQGFNEDFHKDNNIEGIQARELSEYYTPMVQQANDGFRRKQANENIAFTEDQRFAAFENELLAVISMGRLDGGSGASNASSAQIGQWLNTKAQELYEEGGNWNDIQKTITSIVGNAAASQGSHAILGILDHIEIAGMGRISKTVDGRKMIRAARKTVTARANAASKAANKAASDADKARAAEAETDAMQAAQQGDDEVFTENYNKLVQTAPAKARAVWNFRRTLDSDEEEVIADGAFGEAYVVVKSAGSRSAADDYLDEQAGNGILDWETTNQLRQKAARLYGDVEDQNDLSNVLNDSSLKVLSSNLTKTIIGNEYNSSDAKRDKAASAEMALDDAAISIYNEIKTEDGGYPQIEMRNRLKIEAAALRELYVSPGVIADNKQFQLNPTPTPPPSEGGLVEPVTPLWAE